MASHTIGEYVISSAHNFSFTLEFANFIFPSYFMAQEASMASKISTTKQITQTDGLAYGSSPITRAKEAWAVMP
jgi:hypothetical protein